MMNKNFDPTLFEEKEMTMTKIPVGIHSKVKITSVEVADSYFDINFDKEGLKHNIRKWEPNDKYPLTVNVDGEQVTETPEQTIDRKIKENLGPLNKALKVLATEEEQEDIKKRKYESYEEYIKALAKFINKRIMDNERNKTHKYVNIKLIYDKDGMYSVFPRYGYMEEYKEGMEPTLKYSDYEIKNSITPKSRNVKDDDLL
jgi:hypothetical protein